MRLSRSSAARRSVTSSNVPRMPMTSPSRSRSGTFWVSTQRRSPLGPAQPLDDADDRLAGLGDVGVPVHEPVGAELGVVGPRHVPVGLADQVVGLGPGEGGEHPVAAEVARLQVLPEHGVGRRVHQHLEQLLARLEGVVAAHPALQQGGVQVDVRAHVPRSVVLIPPRLHRSRSARRPARARRRRRCGSA